MSAGWANDATASPQRKNRETGNKRMVGRSVSVDGGGLRRGRGPAVGEGERGAFAVEGDASDPLARARNVTQLAGAAVERHDQPAVDGGAVRCERKVRMPGEPEPEILWRSGECADRER